MSHWLFNVYMDGVMREVKMWMGRRGVSFMEDERESGDCLANFYRCRRENVGTNVPRCQP